jgi:hypothetical protein
MLYRPKSTFLLSAFCFASLAVSACGPQRIDTPVHMPRPVPEDVERIPGFDPGTLFDRIPLPTPTGANDAAQYWISPVMVYWVDRYYPTGTYDHTLPYVINLSMTVPLRVRMECYNRGGEVIPPLRSGREVPPLGAFVFTLPDPADESPIRYWNRNEHYCYLSGDAPFLTGGIREYRHEGALRIAETVSFFRLGG